MENDILVIVEESIIFGKVFGAMNATFLVVIPKKNNPTPFDWAIHQLG